MAASHATNTKLQLVTPEAAGPRPVGVPVELRNAIEIMHSEASVVETVLKGHTTEMKLLEMRDRLLHLSGLVLAAHRLTDEHIVRVGR